MAKKTTDDEIESFDEDFDWGDMGDDGEEEAKPAKPAKKNKPAKTAPVEDDDDDNDGNTDDDDNEGSDDDDHDDDDQVDDDGSDDDEDDEPKGKSSANEELEAIKRELRQNRLDTLRNQAAMSLSHFAQQVEAADIALAKAKDLRRTAMMANDYDAMEAADERIDQLKQFRVENLGKHNAVKQLAEKLEAGELPGEEKQSKDSGPTRKAKEWMARNPKFDPKSKDEFSLFVRRTSAKLIKEGYNEDSDVHFKELDRRINRKFPGMKNARKNAFGNRGGQVAGATANNGGGSSKRKGPAPNRLYNIAAAAGLELTDERRKRMEEASRRIIAESKKG